MQLWEQWLAVAEQHRTDAVPATRLSVGVHEVEAWPPGAGGEIARGGAWRGCSAAGDNG